MEKNQGCLANLTQDEAKKIYQRVTSRESSWVKEASCLGVSDVGLRKHCAKLLPNFEGFKQDGFVVNCVCAQCRKKFTRMNYELDEDYEPEFLFCNKECGRVWYRENETKNPVAPEKLFEMYNSGMSLRAIARNIGISRKVLGNRLHRFGIRKAPLSQIEDNNLGVFVQKFF